MMLILDTWLRDRDLPPLILQSPGDKGASWRKSLGASRAQACDGDPYKTRQGPQSSSLRLFQSGKHSTEIRGSLASETRAGLWVCLLPTLGQPLTHFTSLICQQRRKVLTLNVCLPFVLWRDSSSFVGNASSPVSKHFPISS